MASIAQGIGRFGSELGQASAFNEQQKRQQAAQQLQQLFAKMQWMELQEKIKQQGITNQQKSPEGIKALLKGVLGRDPSDVELQRYMGVQDPIPKVDTYAQKIGDVEKLLGRPLTEPEKLALGGIVKPETGKPSEFDEWQEQFKVSRGRYPNEREIALWHRQPKEVSGVDANSLDQVAQDVADKKRLLPSGKLGIQVENRIKQLGLKMPPQMPTGVADKLEQRVGTLDNTIRMLEDIQQDADLLDKLPKASLVQLTQSSARVPQILSRFAGLFQSDTDKMRIARLAGNLRSLEESINVIRAPLGAAGFRGPEGWQALQAQSVQALSTPGVNAQVLKNTKELLTRLRDKTNEALTGESGGGGDSTDEAIIKALSGGSGGGPK